MNKKEILKEESNKMRKLMGLPPINEDMLADIINKIKDSDVVKKIEDFFDGDDDKDSDDSKNSDDKRTCLFCEPGPCHPATETALRPPIWRL